MSAEPGGPVVAVGSCVRIRSLRAPEPRLALHPVSGEDRPEEVVTIVQPGEMGLHRLTPRTPLGRALIGRRVGDVVEVRVEARTARFEVLAVEARQG